MIHRVSFGILWGILFFVIPGAMGGLTDSGGHVSESVDWNVFEIKADPLLDRFYVTDSTNRRVLAIDAQSGAVVASAGLGTGSFLGAMQFSLDGTRIHVANASDNRIYAFRTTDLSPLGSIDVGAQVTNFVFGFDGYVYLVKEDPIDELHKIDPATGVSVDFLPYPGIEKEYKLVRSKSGHRIFAVSTWISGGVYQSATRYGKLPLRFQPFQSTNGGGASFWDENNAFLSPAQFPGINPKGIANHESTPWVFISDDNNNSGIPAGVRSYRKSDKTPHRSWALPSPAGAQCVAGAIAVSQSGNLLYAVSVVGAGHQLRLIRPSEDPGAPPVVLKVRATGGAYPDRVLVEWEDMAEVDFFEVIRSDSTGSRTVLGQTTENHWVDSSVIAGTQFSYGIRAIVNGSGQSSNSMPHATGFAASDFPQTPYHIRATGGDEAIHLSWNRLPSATSYEIHRSATHLFENAELLASTEATEWVDGSVVPGIHYYYWLRSVNASGVSGFSPSSFSRIQRNQLGAPLFISASDGAYEGAVEVIWGGPESGPHTIYRNTRNDPAEAEELATSVTGGLYMDESVEEGVRYFYWARLTPSYGTGPLSEVDAGFSKTDLTLASEEISASDGDFDDRIEVKWLEAPNADTYELFRSPEGGSGGEVSLGIISGISFPDESVDPDTVYRYRVNAINQLGTSDFSVSDTGFRVDKKPDAPGNVRATTGAFADKIRVFWNLSPRASSYSVYRSLQTNPATAALIATGLTSTTFDDSTVTQQVFYNYWVKATNSGGTSGFSNRGTGASTPQPPPPPSLVTASDGAYHDRVTVSWSPAPGAVSYRVFRSHFNDFATATELVRDHGSLSWTDFSVPRLTPQFYWIVAVNTWGVGQPGVSEQGNTRSVQLGAPSNLVVSQGTFVGRVALSWSVAADASGYRVFRREAPNGSFSFVGSTFDVSYSDTSAVPGRRFIYEVRAYHPEVPLSGPSPEASGFSGIGVPSGISASSGEFQGFIKIKWDAVNGAERFEVLRGTSASGSDADVIGSTTATEFVDEGATPGDVYHYSVRAVAGEAIGSSGNFDEGHGTVGLPYRPDLLVGMAPGLLLGNDVYDGPGIQQIRKVSKRHGLFRFVIEVQNDGESPDLITLRLSPGDRNFAVSMVDALGTNVSSEAITGRLERSFPSRSGAVYSLNVKSNSRVKAKRMSRIFQVFGYSTSIAVLSDSVQAGCSILSKTRKRR